MTPPIYLVFCPIHCLSVKSNDLLLKVEISMLCKSGMNWKLIKNIFEKVFIIFLKVV